MTNLKLDKVAELLRATRRLLLSSGVSRLRSLLPLCELAIHGSFVMHLCTVVNLGPFLTEDCQVWHAKHAEQEKTSSQLIVRGLEDTSQEKLLAATDTRKLKEIKHRSREK